MEKKINLVLIVIIIVLIFVLLGAGIYIAYDNGVIFNNSNQSENKNSDEKPNLEKEIDIALDDSRFISIYNKLNNYTYKTNREDGYNSFTNYELAVIGMTDLQESNFIKTTEYDEYRRFYYKLKGDVVINQLKKYFSNDVNFNREGLTDFSVVIPGVNFDEGNGMTINTYDSNTDEFTVVFGGVGGFAGLQPVINERKIVSAKIKDNTIIVEEKAIYYEVSNYNYSIFGDPSKLIHIENKIFDPETMHRQLLISIDNYLDQASTIIHTYKLDENTGNYYFVSSVIK